MQLQEIEVEIENLSAHDRASLAKKIIDSLNVYETNLSDAEIEALWVEEAERRLDEIHTGVAQEIPAEEAFERSCNAIS